MKKQITILMEYPSGTDFNEAYQLLFNVADDIGDVIDLSIRTPPKEYESYRSLNRARVLKAATLKTPRGRALFQTIDEIRARLGPEKRSLIEYLEELTHQGKLERVDNRWRVKS